MFGMCFGLDTKTNRINKNNNKTAFLIAAKNNKWQIVRLNSPNISKILHFSLCNKHNIDAVWYGSQMKL